MSLPTLYLSLLLLFPCCVTSFDISKILSQYPAFSTFSNYLSQAQLASEINNRQTITVLAVDNGGMSPVSGKSMDVIKKVLSLHVILDYYDVQKLQHLDNNTATVTTLFQASGQARGQQGFLKITDVGTGGVSFVPASEESGVGSNLIKAVASQPYNLSVVQISSVIMPSSLIASSPQRQPPSPSPAAPVPVVVSPVPVTVPVPVASPVPVIVPVPVKSPVPVVSPVPVKSPVPVVSPVPVKSPVPVVSPVPVKSPVPVVSPVPVKSPVPVGSPVPVPSPSGAADGGGESKSGAGTNWGATSALLATVIALVSAYLESKYVI